MTFILARVTCAHSYTQWAFHKSNNIRHNVVLRSVYLNASPTGVPDIMCLAQKCVNCTPFSRKSVSP